MYRLVYETIVRIREGQNIRAPLYIWNLSDLWGNSANVFQLQIFHRNKYHLCFHHRCTLNHQNSQLISLVQVSSVYQPQRYAVWFWYNISLTKVDTLFPVILVPGAAIKYYKRQIAVNILKENKEILREN